MDSFKVNFVLFNYVVYRFRLNRISDDEKNGQSNEVIFFKHKGFILALEYYLCEQGKWRKITSEAGACSAQASDDFCSKLAAVGVICLPSGPGLVGALTDAYGLEEIFCCNFSQGAIK